MMRQPSTLTKKECETYSEEEKNNQLIVKKKVSPARYTIDPTIDLKLGSTKANYDWWDVADYLSDLYGVQMDNSISSAFAQGYLDGPDTEIVARIFIANQTNEVFKIKSCTMSVGQVYDKNHPYKGDIVPGYLYSHTLYGDSKGIRNVRMNIESSKGSFVLKADHFKYGNRYFNEINAEFDPNKYTMLPFLTLGNGHSIVGYGLYYKGGEYNDVDDMK